ncbi:MAG: endonuclease III [Terriglobales bacterium]
MVRGTIPRQPSKAGRHEGVKQQPRRAESRGISRHPKTKTVPLPGQKAAEAKRGAAPKGYNPLDPKRIPDILARLDQRYPGATCALHHRNAWELLVATILSAQCTDARVNMVTPELFRKYPTPQGMARLKPEELEPDIKSTGFFRNKSKAIVGAAKAIVEQHGGRVPENMNELLELPGVARKTANVVLGTWFGKAEGVVVDTHVRRIARRLELTKETDPSKIEQDLMRVIPREKWIVFAHQLILHGRALCLARQPKCADCPLENICHAEDKTWSTVTMHKGAR